MSISANRLPFVDSLPTISRSNAFFGQLEYYSVFLDVPFPFAEDAMRTGLCIFKARACSSGPRKCSKNTLNGLVGSRGRRNAQDVGIVTGCGEDEGVGGA